MKKKGVGIVLLEINEILNTIVKGDTIEILQAIPDESVDLIFADPPYNMQLSGTLIRREGTKFDGVADEEWDHFDTLDDYRIFTRNWLKECQRILKKDGSLWVIGSFQNIYMIGDILQDLGYWIINDIIWNKNNPVPNFSGSRFTNAHETLIWCVKNEKSKFHFNYQTMKYLNGGKQMRSVWDIPICNGSERLKNKDGEKVHPTQKPEEILYRVIASSSQLEDVVLDPFMGSGTTGAVAKRMGRNYIGIEREQKYIDAATKRIDDTVVGISDIELATRDQKEPRVPIEKLIEAGYLNVGQLLYNSNKTIEAELLENGKLLYEGETDSIHKTAAKTLGQLNHNGWGYWFSVDSDGDLISINDLRKKYREEKDEGK